MRDSNPPFGAVSGRRGSNPLPRRWQRRAQPHELHPRVCENRESNPVIQLGGLAHHRQCFSRKRPMRDLNPRSSDRQSAALIQTRPMRQVEISKLGGGVEPPLLAYQASFLAELEDHSEVSRSVTGGVVICDRPDVGIEPTESAVQKRVPSQHGNPAES